MMTMVMSFGGAMVDSDDVSVSRQPKTLMFHPINTVRVSSIIVDRIKVLIREGVLKPNDKLPSERELCQSFGIGRATVRDALRILETMGLIEIRVGSRGGAFVTAPSSTSIANGLNDMIATSTLSAAEVREARLSFEVGLIDLICERITSDDLNVLDKVCSDSLIALEQGCYSLSLSLQFHRALAHCAHNRALDMIVDTFQVTLELFDKPLGEDEPDRGHPGVQEHIELVEAIRSNNPILAKSLLELHRSRTPFRFQMIA